MTQEYDLRPPRACQSHNPAAFGVGDGNRWCPSCGAIWFANQHEWKIPTSMFYRPPQNDDEYLRGLAAEAYAKLPPIDAARKFLSDVEAASMAYRRAIGEAR